MLLPPPTAIPLAKREKGESLLGAAAFALLVLSTQFGCASESGIVVRASGAEQRQLLAAQSSPLIYLTASREKEAVAEQLRAAGFQLAGGIAETPYLLRVTVGVPFGGKDCGSLRNVRYSLRRGKRTLIEVNERGWSGSCQPNVFEHASRQLMQELRNSK